MYIFLKAKLQENIWFPSKGQIHFWQISDLIHYILEEQNTSITHTVVLLHTDATIKKSLWWNQHQFIQPANNLLQLHPIDKSLPIPPIQQQSLYLKEQQCSIRPWKLIRSPSPAVDPLCWVVPQIDWPLSQEPDSVDLGDGGQGWEGRDNRRKGGGVRSSLQSLSSFSSVLSIPFASALSFLWQKMKGIQTGIQTGECKYCKLETVESVKFILCVLSSYCNFLIWHQTLIL